MQVRPRARPEPRPLPLGVLVGGPVRRRRRWPWMLAGLVALAAVLAALGLAFFAWPRGTIVFTSVGLPQVRGPRFGATLARVSVRTAAGAAVPVRRGERGVLRPVRPVTPGTRLFVEAVFRRPGWVGWIAGGTQTVRAQVTAPRARLVQRWLRVKAGAPVRVRFDRLVREVEVTGLGSPRLRRLRRPARTVALGRLGAAGSAGVSAVAEPWERLPPATSITWFPPGKAPMLLVSPKPGGQLGPHTQLRLRFSGPVRTLLHGRMPTFQPAVAGHWRAVDTRTLVFTPRGYGFGLDTNLQLRLPVPVVRIGGAARPTRAVGWETPTGTQLRLQQLLAELGYLPLRWIPAQADSRTTIEREFAAAADPPAGHFVWRYPDIPASLVDLWHPGRSNVIVRGALMAFEDTHDLAVDGFDGRRVWQALIADELAGRIHPGGYSYVYVHLDVPQSLNLWHDGRTILSSPGNTGVPAAPTQVGTFAVFEHVPIGTMSGTNPDGSHYFDPGIRYISYFNGGDAIHAFNRDSFGTPQSLGCVELPLAAAAKVWPYTPIGTLVTIEH